MNSRYEIASIHLDSDGIFWIYYYGEVPEQGGSRFGRGSMGLHTLDDAINVLKSILETNLDTYKKLIQEKTEVGK